MGDMPWGWAAGGGTESFILYTSDGGNTWDVQELGTSVSWYTMQFVNSQVGYAAGWDGDIIRTTNGGLGMNEIKNDGKNELILYPNPANESVTISCPASGNSISMLKVFDMMGKEMYSGLLTSSLFTLNVSGFPDGIYIVEVLRSNHIMTNKLIIAR